MAHFVLVHGASHGGWSWRHVVPRLEAMGHQAIAVDLPSHENVTLAEYRDTVLAAVEPGSILVGHSLGGLTITLAGAARPDLNALIYVAAFVPDPGTCFVEFRKDAVSAAVSDVTEREGGFSLPLPDVAADVFYNHCSEGDRAFALARMSPQPISVMTETLDFDPPNLPRHFVICADDRVVLPAYQHRITEGWPQGTVHELATGHSPFFSDPDGLAGILGAIADQEE